MLFEIVVSLMSLVAFGIEAAWIPTDDGSGDYLVRVEPDLVKQSSTHAFSSDVPADAQNIRRVQIYVADAWPPAVERTVAEAASRSRMPRVVQAIATRSADADPVAATVAQSKPWGWLMASLVVLFLSLGANAYLGMLLGSLRSRYQEAITEGIARA